MAELGIPQFVPYVALTRYQISVPEVNLVRLIRQGALRAGIHYRRVSPPGIALRCYHWNPTAIRRWQRCSSSLQRCPKP